MKSTHIVVGFALALAFAGASALRPRLLHPRPLVPRTVAHLPVVARPFAAPSAAPQMESPVPADVLACLNSHGEPAERQQLLHAAMRGWGERDVVAAIAWALEQNESWSALAIEAALGGAAATRPDFAAEIGRRLLAADPEVGVAQASALIGLLASSGRFDLALQLATDAPATIAPDLTADAFVAWARQAPDAALAALAQFSDPSLRHAALLGVIEGWAVSDPAGLAQRAWSSFSGEDRRFALRQAIDSWAEKDLGGLTGWLDALPPGPVLDDGAAVAATGLIANNPRAAFAWTARISDADGRFRTLQRVATEVDRAVARSCVGEMAGLAPAERSALLRQLDCTP